MIDYKLIATIAYVEKKTPFGALLYISRYIRNESIEQASEALGLTKKQIIDYESGKQKPTKHMNKIIKHYGLSLEQIQKTREKKGSEEIINKLKEIQSNLNVCLSEFTKDFVSGYNYYTKIKKEEICPFEELLKQVMQHNINEALYLPAETKFDVDEMITCLRTFYNFDSDFKTAAYIGRSLKNLSYQKVGEILGVSKQRVFRLENEKRPQKEIIEKYSKLLGINLSKYL